MIVLQRLIHLISTMIARADGHDESLFLGGESCDVRVGRSKRGRREASEKACNDAAAGKGMQTPCSALQADGSLRANQTGIVQAS